MRRRRRRLYHFWCNENKDGTMNGWNENGWSDEWFNKFAGSGYELVNLLLKSCYNKSFQLGGARTSTVVLSSQRRAANINYEYHKYVTPAFPHKFIQIFLQPNYALLIKLHLYAQTMVPCLPWTLDTVRHFIRRFRKSSIIYSSSFQYFSTSSSSFRSITQRGPWLA